MSDVTELVQLRERVDAVEAQLTALQTETETQRDEIVSLQAEVQRLNDNTKPDPA